jgi:hypothetical protein
MTEYQGNRVVIIIGGMFAMGLFGFLKQKKANAVVYRLVWFELQIAPATYRFAILPEQPILIGLEGENGEKGVTMLIRYDHVPEVYERIVERISDLVQKSKVMELPPKNPQVAFDDGAIKNPSVHIRIAYSNDRRWASVFEMNKIPKEIETLIQETKKFAKKIMKEQSSEKISGEKALAHLDADRNVAQKEFPAIVTKIKVCLSGNILVNDQEVSLSELGLILDELKAKNGVVWYFRESPEQEPTELTSITIQKVLDAIVNRKLPVKLQTEEY